MKHKQHGKILQKKEVLKMNDTEWIAESFRVEEELETY